MVGDNVEWDVVAPRRLGLKGIWLVPDVRAGQEACADVVDAIVPDLPALARLLSSLPGRA